jgi:hypothetical protein
LAREVGNQELEAESLIGIAAALIRSGRPLDGARHAQGFAEQALAAHRTTGHHAGLAAATALHERIERA